MACLVVQGTVLGRRGRHLLVRVSQDGQALRSLGFCVAKMLPRLFQDETSQAQGKWREVIGWLSAFQGFLRMYNCRSGCMHIAQECIGSHVFVCCGQMQEKVTTKNIHKAVNLPDGT